jgi:hypothetical protein
VTGPGGPLQGFGSSEVSRKRFRLLGPSWDCPVFRSVTDLVVGIWFATPAPPFRRPRGFPKIRHPAPRYGSSLDLDFPTGFTSLTPPESCAAPAALLRFISPTATSTRRSTHPGFQTRFVPPSGFSTLLTVYSLRAFRPRGPVPLMGFTLQSVTPPQSRAPCSADSLLPFLTSRAPALRTRRSRCPATPGL